MTRNRLWLAAALVAVAACATRRDVEEIVGASNAALILADSDPGLAAPGGADADWEAQVRDKSDDAIARIDAFLAQHEGNPNLQRTLNALRLRKALLLTFTGRRNLARATYAQADRELAGNARDIALIDSSEVLIWWQDAAAGEFRASDADRHIATLDRVIEAAPPGSGIRYYLATLRAHIALKRASADVDPRAGFRAGLAAYAAEFDEAARENVRIWIAGDPAELEAIPTGALRWYGHAPITRAMYSQAYVDFLDETRSAFEADPANVDPVLRRALEDGTFEREPAWPDACGWLFRLEG
jgi:hypothetical protein